MDLVDEQHIALLQVGQQGGKVAGLFNSRAAGDADLYSHLVGNNARQRSLAQTRRAVQQNVIHRLAPALGGFQINFKVLLGLFLPDVVLQMLRAEVIFLTVRRGHDGLHHFCAV